MVAVCTSLAIMGADYEVTTSGALEIMSIEYVHVSAQGLREFCQIFPKFYPSGLPLTEHWHTEKAAKHLVFCRPFKFAAFQVAPELL